MPLRSDEILAAQAIEAGAYEEAVRLLRPLAERNSAYALLTLGWIYETGATGAPDKDAARSLYEQAVSQGDATACRYLGGLLWRSGHEAEARKAFERGAQLDDDECKSELTRLTDAVDEKLARQALHEQAYQDAVRLLLPLAEHNSKFALVSLGYIYETGAMGAPDWKAARSYYERAASQGSAVGCFELGRLLKRQGEEAQARAAFEAGAELGHLPSMSRLGTMMIDGHGGPAEVDAGKAWLEKAASNGHILAQRKLLVIEMRNSKSLFKKAAVAMNIVALAIKYSREMSEDPDLDRVR